MLTAGQLALRRTGITAGDVRALVGEDPYSRTAHDVFIAKTLVDAPFEESEAMSLGNELEPMVIRRLAAKRGLHVVRREPDRMTVVHPEHPTHIATPDAWLAPSAFHPAEAIAEVKVVGMHNAHEWGEPEGDAPDWVIIQATWQAHVTSMPLVHVGALIGTEVRPFVVRPDPDLEEALIEAADRFWTDHVLPRKPPPVDGSEGAKRMLRAVWPRERRHMLRAGPEIEQLARQYFEANRTKQSAEAAAELARQQLAEIVGEHEGIAGDGWRLLLRWQEPCEVAASSRAGYRRFDLRPVKAAKGSRAA